MNTISRVISGIIIMGLGVWLIVSEYPDPWALLSGVIIVGIGIALFINKKEDEIEKIRSHNENSDK